jgi:hypothetical protein
MLALTVTPSPLTGAASPVLVRHPLPAAAPGSRERASQAPLAA